MPWKQASHFILPVLLPHFSFDSKCTLVAPQLSVHCAYCMTRASIWIGSVIACKDTDESPTAHPWSPSWT